MKIIKIALALVLLATISCVSIKKINSLEKREEKGIFDFITKKLDVARKWVEVRNKYNEIVATIPTQIASLKTNEEKAKKAFEIRHSARMSCRDIMDKPSREKLEARDLKVYKNKDGPTYDDLVKKLKAKQGKTVDMDKIYKDIIASSQRTNWYVNKAIKFFGFVLGKSTTDTEVEDAQTNLAEDPAEKVFEK